MTRSGVALLTLLAPLILGSGVRAEGDLTELDLTALMSMDVTVTSAAKRAQATHDAAAAVYVITREEIRRSGATSIPELLRFVPGLQVARINTRGWAVSARGFNSRFSNKLQVLVDGRSIYAVIFSGVVWEEQPVPLEEIERIEVIRGPGGALWGINAMNGVINVITRRAGDSSGLHLSAGAGTEINNAATVRYDTQLADLGDLRLYAEHAERDPFDGDVTGLKRTQGGLRFDRKAGSDNFILQGDFADSEFGDPRLFSADSALPASASVGNLGFGWRHDHSDQAQTELRAQYAWTVRGQPGRWDETMLGFDAQHTAARHGRHLATFGAGYRHETDDQLGEGSELYFSKTSLQHDKWSVYAQDEIYYLDDHVRLIAGAKLEGFKYSGLAFQPTLRAIWHASEQHTFWGAASRAARSPSRFELHSRILVSVPAPSGPATYLQVTGSENLDAEELNAFEMGWRWRPGRHLTVDLALFQHDYTKLLVQIAQAPMLVTTPPRLILPLQYGNALEASAHGAELAAEWRVNDRLRLQVGAHWLDMDLPIVQNTLNAFGAEPPYTGSLRARIDIAQHMELDLSLRAVARIEQHALPSYQSFDLRFGWEPRDGLRLSMGVENIFDDTHVEFFDEVTQSTGVTLGRNVFGRLTWKIPE